MVENIKSVDCLFDLKLVNYLLTYLMNFQMTAEIESGEESLFADEALEFVVTYMHCYMLVEVGLLGESLAAPVKMTKEGAFSSVSAKMVEQVVPFSEGLVALNAFGVAHGAN